MGFTASFLIPGGDKVFLREGIKTELKDIFVLAADVSPLREPGLFKKALSTVSEERREKIGRSRLLKDKVLSLGAELLLMYALREKAGLETLPETVRGEGLKPAFKSGGPEFNLSHSGEWSMCAVSPFKTGCDIEKIKDANMRLARRFFTEKEYADILSCPTDEEKKLLFFRYWTLKESFIKAEGAGLRMPLNSFELTLGEKITVSRHGREENYTFREYGIPGYRCALCAAGSIPLPDITICDIEKTISSGA